MKKAILMCAAVVCMAMGTKEVPVENSNSLVKLKQFNAFYEKDLGTVLLSWSIETPEKVVGIFDVERTETPLKENSWKKIDIGLTGAGMSDHVNICSTVDENPISESENYYRVTYLPLTGGKDFPETFYLRYSVFVPKFIPEKE